MADREFLKGCRAVMQKLFKEKPFHVRTDHLNYEKLKWDIGRYTIIVESYTRQDGYVSRSWLVKVYLPWADPYDPEPICDQWCASGDSVQSFEHFMTKFADIIKQWKEDLGE